MSAASAPCAGAGAGAAMGAVAGVGTTSATVLELRVRNHPGAMSHICGLFARRAFNLEAIVCVPNADDGGAMSTMLLLVADEPRLDQVERQLAKLHDVLAVRERRDLGREFFARAVDVGDAMARPASRVV